MNGTPLTTIAPHAFRKRQLVEGFDGFVPLIDSGLYIAASMKPRLFSTI